MDVLTVTGRSTCGNCGMPIVRLAGSFTPEHWTHSGRGVNGGSYSETCEGAPVATPTEVQEVTRG